MTDGRFQSLLLATYACLGIGYSLLVPVWEASDEPSHYRLALVLARGGEPPSPRENYEASQPRLYYRLASLPLALLDRIDPALVEIHLPPLRAGLYQEPSGRKRSDAYSRLTVHEAFDGMPVFDWSDRNHRVIVGPLLLRWLNLVVGGVALSLLFRGACRFSPDSPEIPRAALALAALNPQYLHVVTSVGNDAVGILAGATLFCLLGAGQNGQSGFALVATACLALILPPATKLTVVPMSIAALLFTLWSALGSRRQNPRCVALALFLLVAVGWVFLGAWEGSSGLFWRATAVHPGAPELWRAGLESIARSYWGAIGWMSVGLPWIAWIPLTFAASLGVFAALAISSPPAPGVSRWRRPRVIACGSGLLAVGVLLNSWIAALWTLALAGCLYGALRREDKPLPRIRREVWLWIAFALVLLAAFKNMLATLQGQGRYLFPGNGPLVVAIATGWLSWLPPSLRALLPAGAIMVMLASNLLMWCSGVLPVYYQPFLD